MAPQQPTHNLQDDLSPGTAKQANLQSSASDATFGHLQRAHRSGGVLPEYPSDAGTTPGSRGGGQSD